MQALINQNARIVEYENQHFETMKKKKKKKIYHKKTNKRSDQQKGNHTTQKAIHPRRRCPTQLRRKQEKEKLTQSDLKHLWPSQGSGQTCFTLVQVWLSLANTEFVSSSCLAKRKTKVEQNKFHPLNILSGAKS